MSAFLQALRASPKRHGRPQRWVYLPYDQLTTEIGLARTENPEQVGIILIENRWKARRRPYHKQKLAFILGNLRFFALECTERGYHVEYRFHDGPYRDAIARVAHEVGATIECMVPAERELRADLAPLVERGTLVLHRHEGWLTSEELFRSSQKPDKGLRMDAFYRAARRSTGWLMEDGKPMGGKFSFDPDNRKAYKGDPPLPSLPSFETSHPVKQEVVALVNELFESHPGNIDLSTLPLTRSEHVALWNHFREAAAVHFGPFQDAMAQDARTLFHSRVSGSLHLHRILPQQAVAEIADADIPLSSKEGFIRQVLGWREFMRHVHRETDGFRTPGVPVAPTPGDAGYGAWRGVEWKPSDSPGIDGGAAPSALGSDRPLPPAFWGTASGLNCLDTVVSEVWDDGYGHHITRLMILANIATLLDVHPRELTDWFWVAYQDAFDWVVEPNVLGMGTYGVGGMMTTKPYVSGSNYIDKMSDYCRGCSFNPKKDCPVRDLYWAFLDRHRDVLEGNIRLAMPYRSLAKKTDAQRAEHQRVFEETAAQLTRGGTLRRRKIA